MAQILRGFGPLGVDPHARVLGEPSRRDPERGQGVDDELLDVAHVLGRTEAVAELDDRVADQLTGPVVGDVAAAADADEVGPDRGRVAAQVVLEVRARPVREHVGVLEQQQVLPGAVVEQGLLDRQRLAVGDGPQPADAQRRGDHSSADQSLVSRISLIRRRKLAA